MTIEELKQKEFESFKKDLEELIDKHKETLLILKMGIIINYNVSCVHYKGDSYCISTSGEMDVKPITEWYD